MGWRDTTTSPLLRCSVGTPDWGGRAVARNGVLFSAAPVTRHGAATRVPMSCIAGESELAVRIIRGW